MGPCSQALGTRPTRQATTPDRLEVRTLTLVGAAGVRRPGAAQVSAWSHGAQP
jgi:hypothetical protein